jgi:predicted metalloendopeptidase
MIASIQEAFAELLNEVTWMDEATKEVAREKVRVTMTSQYDGDIMR